MTRFVAGIVLLTALAASSAAYAGSGGSMYSLIGIGDLRYTSGGRSAGMGYTGTAVTSANYLDPMDPATWFRLNRTRLDAGILYEGFASGDRSRSRYLAHLSFNGIAIGLPVSAEHGITVVGAFLPYSNVDYDTYTNGTGFAGTDSIPYSFHHVGTGGISIGRLGLSYVPLPSLSVGAAFDYYFGTVDYTGTYLPVTTTLGGGQFSRSTSYRGAGVTLGALITSLSGVSEALRPISIGATVSTRAVLSTSEQTVLGFGTDVLTSATELDTTAEKIGQIVIPLRYSLGISYMASERSLLAADVGGQLWKQSSLNGTTSADIRNSTRIGVGFERLPSREVNAPWLARLAFRLGGLYEASYYRPGTTPINTWLVTGGFSLPITPDSRLNLSAEYGMRGTTDAGLVRDRIFRLNASVTIGELWFIRTEED